MKFAPTLLIMTVITTAILVISACTPLQQQENKTKNDTQPEAECFSDTGCGIGGCSGQVCTTAAEAKDIFTTCEYRAEYDCLKLTSCGCVEGKCGWKETPELKSCLDTAKPQQQLPQQEQPR